MLSPKNTRSTAFRIGPWLVQPRLHRLTRDEQVITLEPKVMDVLVVLARHAGDVVLRDELLETIWADQVVTEEALTRCISALRSAFGDDYQQPAFIETIRKTGYRLIAPVSPEVVPPPSTVPAPSRTPEQPRSEQTRPWPRVLGALALVSLALLGTYIWRTTPAVSPALKIAPFTTYVGNEMQPAFAPDGNHVAFAWDNREGTRLDIYIKAAQEETPFRVTRDSAYEVSPTWSPDGSRLAFARVWNGCEILTVPMLGGPQRKLADCGGWGNPQLDWSPNADVPLLAISETPSRQEPHRIALLSLETLEKHPLTSPAPQHRGDRMPRFSPDGETIAFVRTTDEVSDIYLVPVAGGEPSRLTTDHLDIAGLAWTPDGRNLLYATNRTGTYSLWRIAAAGGLPDLVLAGGEEILHPALSGKEGQLVYEQWSNETNIYRGAVAPASSATVPTAFIASTRWDAEPQYAPTGDRVAFVSNRSGTYEIWTSEGDGSHPVQRTHFDGPVTRHPRWAPDGARLAFDSRVAGNADIYLLDDAGGRPQRLTTDPAIDVYPSWSADGQSIFFASDRSGTWQVWQITTEGGAAAQVTHRGGFFAQAAPDGQTLYYTRRDTAGLWQTPIAGGAEMLALPALSAEYREAWTIRPEGIYFLHREEDTDLTLAFFETATARRSTITTLAVSNRRPGFTLSPDGQWFLYAQLDRSESDLVWVEGLR